MEPGIVRIWLISICWYILGGVTLAQLDEELPFADTSSPRSTLNSFLQSCNQFHQLIETDHYFDRTDPKHVRIGRRVFDCLDTSHLPTFALEDRAGEVAVCIKEILDRHALPNLDDVPDVTAIEQAGGFEKLSRWRIPGTRITISRMESGPHKHEYLFSAGTVDRAVSYFKAVESKPYRSDGHATSPGLHQWYISAPGRPIVGQIVKLLPDSLRFGTTWGMANWKWPTLVISGLLCIGLMGLCYRWQWQAAMAAAGKTARAHLFVILFPVLAMLVPFVFEHFVEDYLTVRGSPLYVVSFASTAMATLATIVVVFCVFHQITESVIASPLVNPRGLNAQLIRITMRLTSLALALTVFMTGGQYLGIAVGTLLASAGIGGLALALGAQDTLKTLFGTLMLMADRPFRVGERIVFKDYDGIVEDIGLRSTKIRLLTSHQVTIPNDELSRLDIENIGRRKNIRRLADLHIPLDTPVAKVESALSIVRRALDRHEGMDESLPPRVFFLEFLPHAFTIRMMYWYHPPKYWDYLHFSEQLNLKIFREFEAAGIPFSLPQRVTTSTGPTAPSPADLVHHEELPPAS